jgi:hypothetical protein
MRDRVRAGLRQNLNTKDTKATKEHEDARFAAYYSDLVGVLFTKSYLRDLECPFVSFVPSC